MGKIEMDCNANIFSYFLCRFQIQTLPFLQRKRLGKFASAFDIFTLVQCILLLHACNKFLTFLVLVRVQNVFKEKGFKA